MKKILKMIFGACVLVSIFSLPSFSQGIGPWNFPLNIATSSDGITFSSPVTFQDSAGVPSVVRWKGDTLVAVFQWFRLPNPSPTWDKVAVKFSYDNGLTWTQPVPIVVNNLPPSYQRPFDPTLAVLNSDSLRIYYSSSDGMPTMGLDSTVNTYSAISTDGIHYQFESLPRVDVADRPVIDPAVIYFNNSWHYIAPVGAPQEGAYHFISQNGLNFMRVADITSDNMHNWTGNYMKESNNELRFYGSGENIWYNSTANGGVWNGYVNTNIQGGDPSVVKISANNYLMIYVGQPYNTVAVDENSGKKYVQIFPNPVEDFIFVQSDFEDISYSVFSVEGQLIASGKLAGNRIDARNFQPGIYFLQVHDKNMPNNVFDKLLKFIKH